MLKLVDYNTWNKVNNQLNTSFVIISYNNRRKVPITDIEYRFHSENKNIWLDT